MRGLPEARVTWHLDNWADWQRDRESDFRLGYSYKDGSGAQSNASRDSDSMRAEVDKRCALATEASIDSLPKEQRDAVAHVHMGTTIKATWRAINDAYLQARMYLSTALARRGIE